MNIRVIAAIAALLAPLWLGTAGVSAQTASPEKPGGTGMVEGVAKQPLGWMQMPMPPMQDWRPNTFMPQITPEAKMKAAQSAMFINPLSLRDMINMMVSKRQVDEGISFDEVVESMDLRANQLNMKKVGHNTPDKVISGITGKPSPRLEILSYCDVLVMREIVDFVPEFVVFLPCRISVLEDATGKIWITTLDWDVRWLDTSQNPNRISKGLREKALRVRKAIDSIMEAGAKGEL